MNRTKAKKSAPKCGFPEQNERQKILWQVKEVIEVKSVMAMVDLLSTGHWIVIAGYKNDDRCKFILGRISN